MLNTLFNQEKCNIYETVSLIETQQQQEQTPRSPRVILKKFSDDVVKPKVKKLLLKKSNSCSTAHNLLRNSFNGKSLSEFSSMLPIQAENSTSTTKTITTLQKNISYDSGQSCNSCLSSSTYSAEVSISNSQTNFGKIESISELPEIEMAERNRLTSKDSDDTTPRNSKNSKEEIVESFTVTKGPSNSYAHNPPRKMQSISSDSYSLSRQTSNSSRSSISNFSRQSSISQKSNSSISQSNPISNSKRRYRATDIWNNLVENFTSKMPIKRHTVHLGLRTYEESFSGRDAVDFIHNYLINSPDFDATVSREQAVMVLCKFFEQNIILLAKERFERAQILKNSCNSIFSSNNFEIRNLANFSYLETSNSQDAQKLRSLQNSSHCCAHGSMINKPGYKPSTSCTEKRKNSFRDDNTIYCFNEKYSEMRHRSRSSFTSTRQSVSKFVSLNNMAILGFSEKSILDLNNTTSSNQPMINEINKNDPTMTQSARLSQVVKPVSKFYNLCSRRQSTGALLRKPLNFDRNFMLGHGRKTEQRVEKDEALVVDDCPCDSVMQNSIPTSSSNHDLNLSSSGVDSKRNSILYRGYDANDSTNFSMPSSRSAFCLSDIAKNRRPNTEQSYPPTARNTAQSPGNHKISPKSKPSRRNSKPKSSVPIELLVNQINGPDGIFSDCHHLGSEGHLAENFDQTVDLNSIPMRKSRIRISVESAEESPTSLTPTSKRDQTFNCDRRNSSTSTCSVDNHVSDISSPIRSHFSGIFTPKKNKDVGSKSKHSLSLTPAKLYKKLVNSPRKSNQKIEKENQPTISSLLKQHTKKLETIWPDHNFSQDTQDVLIKISENQQQDRNSREMNVYEKQRRNSPQETDEPKPIRRKSIKRNKSDGLMLENLDFANSVVIDKNNNPGFANDCVNCGSHLDAIVDDDDVF